MGKKTLVTSDFSGKEIKDDSYYGITVTNFATKSSAKFFCSHDEFMEFVKQYNLNPEWEAWSNRG